MKRSEAILTALLPIAAFSQTSCPGVRKTQMPLVPLAEHVAEPTTMPTAPPWIEAFAAKPEAQIDPLDTKPFQLQLEEALSTHVDLSIEAVQSDCKDAYLEGSSSTSGRNSIDVELRISSSERHCLWAFTDSLTYQQPIKGVICLNRGFKAIGSLRSQPPQNTLYRWDLRCRKDPKISQSATPSAHQF